MSKLFIDSSTTCRNNFYSSWKLWYDEWSIQMVWSIVRHTSVYTSFSTFSEQIMMYWYRLSRQHNLRFELLPMCKCHHKSHTMIWSWHDIFYWSEEDERRSVFLHHEISLCVGFFSHYYEDTRVDKMIALRTDLFFSTVLIHSYVMMSINRIRRHIGPLMKRNMLYRYVRWD